MLRRCSAARRSWWGSSWRNTSGGASERGGEPGSDCGCQTHDGPHWRHLDALWRERNRWILERAKTMPLTTTTDYWQHHLAVLAFAQEEQRRLSEKAAAMEREEGQCGATA